MGSVGVKVSQDWRFFNSPVLLLLQTMLLVALLLLTAERWGALAGSCRESKLCCPGRDSSCVVQKAPINAIIEDLSDKPCYCDHACLKLGDCCGDFKDACGGECEGLASMPGRGRCACSRAPAARAAPAAHAALCVPDLHMFE